MEGFFHLIILYHFHHTNCYDLQTRPFLDERQRGVFATRAPKIPNPIGHSIVRLKGIQGSVLNIFNVDMLDGTPLLDIKPYVPAFYDRANTKIGRLTGKATLACQQIADHRFNE